MSRTTALTKLTPAWHILVTPTFRLITFAVLACYVEVLTAAGHSLLAALFTAVTISTVAGTRSGRPDPIGPAPGAKAQSFT